MRSRRSVVRAGEAAKSPFSVSRSAAAGVLPRAVASNTRWIVSRASIARSNSRLASGRASLAILAAAQAARSSAEFRVSVGVSWPRQ